MLRFTGPRVGLNAKFRPAPDPITAQERNSRKIEPMDRERHQKRMEHISAKAQRAREKGKEAEAAAWESRRVVEELKGLDGRIDAEFEKDFEAWLLGAGKDADHERTHFGRQDMQARMIPGVTEYLHDKIHARYEFKRRLETMDKIGPRSLQDAYLYFKYRVRQMPITDDDLESWLQHNRLPPPPPDDKRPGGPFGGGRPGEDDWKENRRRPRPPDDGSPDETVPRFAKAQPRNEFGQYVARDGMTVAERKREAEDTKEFYDRSAQGTAGAPDIPGTHDSTPQADNLEADLQKKADDRDAAGNPAGDRSTVEIQQQVPSPAADVEMQEQLPDPQTARTAAEAERTAERRRQREERERRRAQETEREAERERRRQKLADLQEGMRTRAQARREAEREAPRPEPLPPRTEGRTAQVAREAREAPEPERQKRRAREKREAETLSRQLERLAQRRQNRETLRAEQAAADMDVVEKTAPRGPDREMVDQALDAAMREIGEQKKEKGTVAEPPAPAPAAPPMNADEQEISERLDAVQEKIIGFSERPENQDAQAAIYDVFKQLQEARRTAFNIQDPAARAQAMRALTDDFILSQRRSAADTLRARFAEVTGVEDEVDEMSMRAIELEEAMDEFEREMGLAPARSNESKERTRARLRDAREQNRVARRVLNDFMDRTDAEIESLPSASQLAYSVFLVSAFAQAEHGTLTADLAAAMLERLGGAVALDPEADAAQVARLQSVISELRLELAAAKIRSVAVAGVDKAGRKEFTGKRRAIGR